MIELLTSPEAWAALLTLTALEIVLGIDNVIFLSVIVSRIPPRQAKRARQINSYYHNLGEGTFDEFPPPMVDTRSKNYLTIALEEVAQGKLKYQYR